MLEQLLRRTLARPSMLIVPVFAAVVATGVIIGGLLFWSSLQVDRASAAREEQILTSALDRSVERIAKDQEASTVWDDAVNEVKHLDLEWLDANLGVWMHDYYGHDRTYILNNRDEPVYAMEEGKRAGPGRFYLIRAAVVPLVQELRRRQAAGESPETSEMQTLGVQNIGVINGHPAIISVKPIVSDTGKIEQAPGTEAVHVSMRYLDGDFITRLAGNFRLQGARFSPTDDSDIREAALPYTARDGGVHGYLIWSPYLPGSSVRGKIAPALAAALAAITLIIGVLVLALRSGASALERSEARARHLAQHDSLTDLPNRILFNERLEAALSHARSGKATVALLALDLDRFKQVNDTLGHPTGDELLRQVGARLCQGVRGSDTVARIGGDEFFVILPNADAWLIDSICARLIGAVHQVFVVFGHNVLIGLSIGMATAPLDGKDKNQLIRHADLALYAAKQRGRGCCVRFTKDLEQASELPRPLGSTFENALQAALTTGEATAR
jgi:diguanylate cyclase (GGDEF)-like protein